MNRLRKIGINNLFEAILFTPKSYTNTFLIKNLDRNTKNLGVLKVKFLSAKRHQKTLKVESLLLEFDEFLEITIFNYKSYHSKIFTPNTQAYIFGSFEFSGVWRINQPKIIKNINQIIMNFNTKAMQSSNLNDIFREVITLPSLLTLGIPQNEADRIYTIFHPESNLAYLTNFAKNNGLFGEYLETMKFVEIFYYMKSLKAKKISFQATSVLNGDYQSFIKSLPFSLTKGQKNCIEVLGSKLASKMATRLVVMGDVGCGKTIIILSCVAIAYPKKSLLLAPTTILAKQLYIEANKFLPKHIKTSLALGGEKNVESCDFLIGTHTLLYMDLSDFDLFMVDEQHRFGTSQRQKIEQMLSIKGKKPHNIQFSATPIPRTMALIQSNFVDFCFIRDLPFKKDIDTKIITKNEFKALLSHIKSEIENNKQVAIIYPLVEKSESITYQSIEEGLPFWQKNFGNVYSTHGKDKNKEEIIENFRDKGSLLIATTLFEVGISLPLLSTIIIVGAERLGFATLHQLRGRVSRNGLKGYCFLYTNNATSARLKDFIHTTNGFEIAELDLKYRQSGDILRGIRQSGEQFKYFDMYLDKNIAMRANELLNAESSIKNKVESNLETTI
ncbi:MAG: ATP-dependent DNA helicase RecG [Helicobacteraceae bacterium]|nr:ATP-dependent DNA helicase RecG [Helicobacteraceae bacterium]